MVMLTPSVFIFIPIEFIGRVGVGGIGIVLNVVLYRFGVYVVVVGPVNERVLVRVGLRNELEIFFFKDRKRNILRG